MFSLGQCLIMQWDAFKRSYKSASLTRFTKMDVGPLIMVRFSIRKKVLETAGWRAFSNKRKNAIFFPSALKSMYRSIHHAKNQRSVA